MWIGTAGEQGALQVYHPAADRFEAFLYTSANYRSAHYHVSSIIDDGDGKARQSDFTCAVERRLDPMLPPVTIVPQDMGRVLLNLLSNAFQAVERRSGEGAVYSPLVEVTTSRSDDGVSISVRGNGSGVPEAILERIFEPFFTTRSAGEGTGLGLSLSHDIITQGHGGRILVTSAEGEGSTFTIVLPTVDNQSAAVIEGRETAEA
jgi:signal transduction histidine kinase